MGRAVVKDALARVSSISISPPSIHLPCHTQLICVCAVVRRRCRKRAREHHVGGGEGEKMKQATRDWRRRGDRCCVTTLTSPNWATWGMGYATRAFICHVVWWTMRRALGTRHGPIHDKLNYCAIGIRKEEIFPTRNLARVRIIPIQLVQGSLSMLGRMQNL